LGEPEALFRGTNHRKEPKMSRPAEPFVVIAFDKDEDPRKVIGPFASDDLAMKYCTIENLPEGTRYFSVVPLVSPPACEAEHISNF
jgi:hypothetical protein